MDYHLADILLLASDFAASPVGRKCLQLVRSDAFSNPAVAQDKFGLFTSVLPEEVLSRCFMWVDYFPSAGAGEAALSNTYLRYK